MGGDPPGPPQVSNAIAKERDEVIEELFKEAMEKVACLAIHSEGGLTDDEQLECLLNIESEQANDWKGRRELLIANYKSENRTICQKREFIAKEADWSELLISSTLTPEAVGGDVTCRTRASVEQ